MSTPDKKKILEAFKKFREFSHLYSGRELDYIYSGFFDYMKYDYISTRSIVCQIFAKTGIYSDDENPYKQFVNIVKRNFYLGCNVVNIAGGHLPMEGIYVYEEQQKIGEGTTTVLDPNIVLKRYGNLSIRKELFDENTDLSDINLIIGNGVGVVLEKAISVATVLGIPYVIGIGGTPPVYYEENLCDSMLLKDWHKNEIKSAESMLNDGDELIVNHDYSRPILICKRKKK